MYAPPAAKNQNAYAQQGAYTDNQYGNQQGSFNAGSYGGYQQSGTYDTNAQINHEQELLKTLIKIFMVIGCLSIGWMLIPLLWLIPMTSKTFKAMDSGAPLTIGFKICVLLFVSRIAGIMLICLND